MPRARVSSHKMTSSGTFFRSSVCQVLGFSWVIDSIVFLPPGIRQSAGGLGSRGAQCKPVVSCLIWKSSSFATIYVLPFFLAGDSFPCRMEKKHSFMAEVGCAPRTSWKKQHRIESQAFSSNTSISRCSCDKPLLLQLYLDMIMYA